MHHWLLIQSISLHIHHSKTGTLCRFVVHMIQTDRQVLFRCSSTQKTTTITHLYHHTPVYYPLSKKGGFYLLQRFFSIPNPKITPPAQEQGRKPPRTHSVRGTQPTQQNVRVKPHRVSPVLFRIRFCCVGNPYSHQRQVTLTTPTPLPVPHYLLSYP